MDKISNEYIRGSLTEKLKRNRRIWYGHVKKRDEMHVMRRVMETNAAVEEN